VTCDSNNEVQLSALHDGCKQGIDQWSCYNFSNPKLSDIMHNVLQRDALEPFLQSTK